MFLHSIPVLPVSKQATHRSSFEVTPAMHLGRILHAFRCDFPHSLDTMCLGQRPHVGALLLHPISSFITIVPFVLFTRRYITTDAFHSKAPVSVKLKAFIIISDSSHCFFACHGRENHSIWKST
jgi:hypothetical protein